MSMTSFEKTENRRKRTIKTLRQGLEILDGTFFKCSKCGDVGWVKNEEGKEDICGCYRAELEQRMHEPEIYERERSVGRETPVAVPVMHDVKEIREKHHQSRGEIPGLPPEQVSGREVRCCHEEVQQDVPPSPGSGKWTRSVKHRLTVPIDLIDLYPGGKHEHPTSQAQQSSNPLRRCERSSQRRPSH